MPSLRLGLRDSDWRFLGRRGRLSWMAAPPSCALTVLPGRAAGASFKLHAVATRKACGDMSTPLKAAGGEGLAEPPPQRAATGAARPAARHTPCALASPLLHYPPDMLPAH